MTNLICYGCNTQFKLPSEDIFYNGKFFHKKCDPIPNVVSLGIVQNEGN